MGPRIRILTAALAAVLAAAVLGLPAQAPAQGAAHRQTTPVIAVVDPLSIVNIVDHPELRIVGETKVAKSLEPQFSRLKKRFQSEIDKQRDSLEAEGKKLNSQRAILAPDVYAQRERELREKAADLQRLYLIRRDQLMRSAGVAIGKVHKEMMQAILEVAKERQINLILPRETVLAAATNLDITGDVVKRIDKAMPSLKLELVKPAAEPPKPGEERRPAQRVPRGLKLPATPK